MEQKADRVKYATSIKKDLLKELKRLSVELDKKQNELLEEAIRLLLEKYKGGKKGE